MTDKTPEGTITPSSSGAPKTPIKTGPSGATASPSVLISEHGQTTIADAVVAKVAGIAAREVPGVHALGGNTARAVGALRGRIPGSSVNHSQGISVEVGETQAAVDIQLVAEYGFSIVDLADGIRRNIISTLEEMTGLQVTEVNIEVQDVHVGTDDDDADQAPAPSRVQ